MAVVRGRPQIIHETSLRVINGYLRKLHVPWMRNYNSDRRETLKIHSSLAAVEEEVDMAGSGLAPPFPSPPAPLPFFSNIFLNLTFFWSSVRTRLGFMPISMHLS